MERVEVEGACRAFDGKGWVAPASVVVLVGVFRANELFRSCGDLSHRQWV